MDTGSVVTPVLGRGAIAESALFGWQSCDGFFFEGLIVAAFEYERVPILLLVIEVFAPGMEGGEMGCFGEYSVETAVRKVEEGQAAVLIVLGVISDCDAASISRGIGLFAIDVVGGARIVDELVDFSAGIGIGFDEFHDVSPGNGGWRKDLRKYNMCVDDPSSDFPL